MIDALTILALFVGPGLAVWINGHLDRRREQRERKKEIFRILMRTRRLRLSPDHVGALNLIEVEFAKDNTVIDQWLALHRHFSSAHQRLPEETVLESSSVEETTDKDNLYWNRVVKDRDKLLTKLLREMATVLGIALEPLDVLEGGYTPEAFGTIDNELRIIREYLVRLSWGERTIPIEIKNLPQNQNNPEEVS